MKDKRITIRVNQAQLKRLKHIFGIEGTHGEDSKAIQLSLNFAENVITKLFGADFKHIFKRRKENIYQGHYE